MKKGFISINKNHPTLFIFAVIIIIIGGLIIYYATNNKQPIIINNYSSRENESNEYNNDTLLNPYAPPFRNESISHSNSSSNSSKSTNIGAVDTFYRQIGILTSSNSKGKIIPLMGRPLFVNRNKWQYYSMNTEASHISVKLPLSKNGKSCTSEYGCDKLYNGDTVYVEGINEAYNVTVYDNDTMRYMPL
jgi:hypothetical protein